jgi:hypothetical protein
MPLRSFADRLKKGGWGLKLERRPRSGTLLDAIAVDGESDGVLREFIVFSL